MSTSVYNNGGMIGVTLDFGATDFYQTSSTVQNDSFTIEATATAADSTNDSEGVTIPAATQDGDLLVVACGHIDTPISEANMASGWTVLANSDDNSDGTPSVQSVILYKIATSSDAGQTFIMGASGGDIDIDYKMFVLRPDNAAITSGTTFTTGEDSYKTFNNPPQLSVNPSGSSGPVFAIAAYAVNTGSQPSASPTPTGNDAVDGTDFYVSHWVYSRADTKPSSITWDAGDGGRNAVSLAYIEIPDSVSVVNQNKKNSGIWNLPSAYSELTIDVQAGALDAQASGTVSIPYPSDIESGDILMAFIWLSGTDDVSSTPSGWTQELQAGNDYIYSKTADGTETGSLAISMSSSATDSTALMYRFRPSKPATFTIEDRVGSFDADGTISITAGSNVSTADTTLFLYNTFVGGPRTLTSGPTNLTLDAGQEGTPAGHWWHAFDIGGETITVTYSSSISEALTRISWR
jgi:hypothetical protein